MNNDVMSFSARLAEIGVIDEKTNEAFLTTMSKGCADSRFPDLVESMLQSVIKWHTTASEIGYLFDPLLAKTVADGMKLVLKFAKSNVSKSNIKMSVADDFVKKLLELEADIEKVEQKKALNPGGDNMNIRQESLEMLKTYLSAIDQQKKTLKQNDVTAYEIANVSYSKMEAIFNSVNSAVDCISKDAALLQTEIFTAINSWEAAFAYGNFSLTSISDLEKAENCAKRWALIPLNVKAKQAKETEYVHKDNIGTRIINYAKTYDAITKIKQAIGLIERAKESHNRMTDTARLEEQNNENKKLLESFKNRIKEIQYLASTRQIDLKSALMEKDGLEKKNMPTLQKAIQRIDDQILGMKQRRIALSTTIMQIENVCRDFLMYENQPVTINQLADQVNFVALTQFLEGSNTSATINDIANMTAIENIIIRKFDEAVENYDNTLDVQLSEINPVDLNEKNEAKQELSDEEMLKLIMGDSGVENTVHADSSYELPADYAKLSITDDDN